MVKEGKKEQVKVSSELAEKYKQEMRDIKTHVFNIRQIYEATIDLRNWATQYRAECSLHIDFSEN